MLTRLLSSLIRLSVDMTRLRDGGAVESAIRGMLPPRSRLTESAVAESSTGVLRDTWRRRGVGVGSAIVLRRFKAAGSMGPHKSLVCSNSVGRAALCLHSA